MADLLLEHIVVSGAGENYIRNLERFATEPEQSLPVQAE